MPSNISPRLILKEISKSFPGVQALDRVTLSLSEGEIHALVGENGAGKSTLIKILSGAYTRDSGQIILEDEPVEIPDPSAALGLGIVTIYQESNLAMDLSIAENIFMGRLPSQGLAVLWGDLYRQTQQLLDDLGVALSPKAMVKDLSPAQRQMVEIAKALSMSARVIVLDEPTASLTEQEVAILMDVMRQLRERSVSLIFITHRLEEVFRIADRVTVLRDGQHITTEQVAEVESEEKIVHQMVGRQIDEIYSKKKTSIGHPILSVHDLSGQGFNDVSFEVRSGEIVGMFGLVGSGRTKVVRTLFGAEPLLEGNIQMDGKDIRSRSPKEAIDSGLALVPEDRKAEGLVLPMSVRENISLPNLRRIAKLGFINFGRERALATEFRDGMDIRCPSIETPARSLSGGNQQKTVVSKWLSRNPRVLILDEPTRGIDVAGKAEVHNLINELADRGVGILMVSSELPEILGVSDRILVMHEGRLVGELPRHEATEESIMAFATGQATDQPPLNSWS